MSLSLRQNDRDILWRTGNRFGSRLHRSLQDVIDENGIPAGESTQIVVSDPALAAAMCTVKGFFGGDFFCFFHIEVLPGDDKMN